MSGVGFEAEGQARAVRLPQKNRGQCDRFAKPAQCPVNPILPQPPDAAISHREVAAEPPCKIPSRKNKIDLRERTG